MRLQNLSWGWQPSYAAILIQMVGWIEHPVVHAEVIALLERAAGRSFGKDVNAMYEWLWSFDPGAHPDYSEFLATFFTDDVDPRFREYFDDRPKTQIRLDEIRWGGVRRDGIPPLKNPKMIRASEATYLGDDNIVFGVVINGDVRAYPKRILAWHEMVKDKIGGLEPERCLLHSMWLDDSVRRDRQRCTSRAGHQRISVSVEQAYVRSCDQVALVHVERHAGRRSIGRSRYRTENVIGGDEHRKEWRRRHPDTWCCHSIPAIVATMEKARAYREYFGTDRLMFNVPKVDDRLLNKAEVLALAHRRATRRTARDRR